MEYLTRLTPNFLCWDRPSGKDGKCSGDLFESQYGFGWEEWLLKDYHAYKNMPEHVCEGFVQAFNGKNQNRTVPILHLYTRVCKNQLGIKPGCYYLGYIENIQSGNFGKLTPQQVQSDLSRVGATMPLIHEDNNVRFKVKNVHFICLDKNLKTQLRLQVGQYRFALYDLNIHRNLNSKIKTIRKKNNL
jgi:hypothetical protein